jgi:hypothetical protein
VTARRPRLGPVAHKAKNIGVGVVAAVRQVDEDLSGFVLEAQVTHLDLLGDDECQVSVPVVV